MDKFLFFLFPAITAFIISTGVLLFESANILSFLF